MDDISPLPEPQLRELRASPTETPRTAALGSETPDSVAGGIAHDFNNLLTVILGNAAMVLRELPDDSPLRPQLERIRCSARVAGELAERLRELPREFED